MRRINCMYFYQLGSVMNDFYAAISSDDSLTPAQWASVSNAKTWLEDLVGDDMMPRTTVIANEILATVTFWLSDRADRDHALLSGDRLNIAKHLLKFHNVLESELGDIYTYFVPSVGAYSTTALMEKADSHLSGQTQSAMTKEEKADFRLAGNCLAYALSTATGFHAMRALEAEARRYHQAATGAATPADWNLDPLINGNSGRGQFGLRDQWKKEGSRNDSPIALIISLLSTISQIYRNPIMHPEMVLDAETAKQVFDTAALAISAMTEDRVKRTT